MQRDLALRITRVVSGGQTGVDRGALDAAMLVDVEHGGWCPQGRLAEDGKIPHKYRLRETESSDYVVRTEQNVMDSDGTLILYRKSITGGTRFTQKMTRKHGKPVLAIDLNLPWDLHRVRQWLADCDIATLNVAGPRGSSHPDIQEEARAFMTALLTCNDIAEDEKEETKT